MGFREVPVFEVKEVLRLWLRGEGLRAIERETRSCLGPSADLRVTASKVGAVDDPCVLNLRGLRGVER
jgi:hypothetical protein